MRVGPKLVADVIVNTMELDASPRDLEAVIRQIIDEHPEWRRDPYTRAAIWCDKVNSYLKSYRSQALEENRQPKIAFNSSSSYMIQGPCFIEPNDSSSVKEQKRRRLYWQDYYRTLRELEPQEFEVLCMKILELLGVHNPRVTQYTADEGIDFYGVLSLGELVESGPGPAFPIFESTLEVWLIGQAKHYRKNKAATPDIRDLVGATNLGRARAFGGPDTKKYQDMKIRVCDPVFMLFFTTGEISSYGWTLVKRSGVVAMDGEMVAAYLADKNVGIVEENGERLFDQTRFEEWLNRDNTGN